LSVGGNLSVGEGRRREKKRGEGSVGEEKKKGGEGRGVKILVVPNVGFFDTLVGRGFHPRIQMLGSAGAASAIRRVRLVGAVAQE